MESPSLVFKRSFNDFSTVKIIQVGALRSIKNFDELTVFSHAIRNPMRAGVTSAIQPRLARELMLSGHKSKTISVFARCEIQTAKRSCFRQKCIFVDEQQTLKNVSCSALKQ